MKTNRRIADRWIANAEAYGIEDQGPDGTSGSTDMANVSWVVPTIHPDLVDHRPARRPATRSSSGTPPAGRRADETVLLAATLVAQTALDLFLDPSLVEQAWAEFRR